MKTVSFVRRKFNAMLGVATVSMAVNFIVMLSGSLVAGNLLGKEGLAGVNVCTPAFAVASFLGSLISVGAGLVFAQAMGVVRSLAFAMPFMGIAMETPFRAFSKIRYLNTLNCNRTEHWFGRHEIRGDSTRRV